MAESTDDDIRAMLNESLHWDEQAWAIYHQSQLSQLLAHARGNCAFYQNRLDPMFPADGTIAWENWQSLPVVTRGDLRDRADEMHARWFPSRHGAVCFASSSGSTGVPITIHTTELAMNIARLAWGRFFRLHGLLPLKGLTEFKVFLPDGKLMTQDTLSGSSNGVPTTYINRRLSTAEKLRVLNEVDCRILVDSPNHSEVLAHENLRSRRQSRISAVIGIGMGFSQEQRDLLKLSFGARCLSPYSSKEGTFMAFQCPHDMQHFHINSELLYLEVLDNKGKPVGEGESGRCIITPLFNSAQPLIRYDQGDIVKRADRCSCGITLPALSSIVGRSDAIFKFPGAQVALFGLDTVLFQRALTADAFQIAQVAPMHLEVRYVSNQDAGAGECQNASDHLRRLLQVDALITFSRIEAIPFNAGGKQQRYVCEI